MTKRLWAKGLKAFPTAPSSPGDSYFAFSVVDSLMTSQTQIKKQQVVLKKRTQVIRGKYSRRHQRDSPGGIREIDWAKERKTQ